MKILFPIGSIYPSQQGGPSNSVYWLAKGLVSKDIEITIVSTDVMLNNTIKRGIWLDLGYGNVIFHNSKVHSIPLKCILTANKELKKTDIIHLNSIFYPYSWIMGLLALWYQKKIVWSIRGELDEKALIYSTWKKKIHLFFFKILFAQKAIFHVTSEEEKKFTISILGKKAKVFDIPNYMILPKRIIAPKLPYFSYIGRIHPKKAIENLIEALSLSKMFLNSEFTFKIAGDINNGYGEQLQKQVYSLGLTRKVTFEGHLEGDLKEEFLAKSYFSFMPSHTENFGLVVIEALAQGTPVIASKGSPWQVLNELNIGYWVENDAKSLSQAINQILLLRQEEYKNMSKNAHEYVTQHFDIYHNVDKWIEVYNR